MNHTAYIITIVLLLLVVAVMGFSLWQFTTEGRSALLELAVAPPPPPPPPPPAPKKGKKKKKMIDTEPDADDADDDDDDPPVHDDGDAPEDETFLADSHSGFAGLKSAVMLH